VDSLPPKDPPYVYAANDQRPRGQREEELCATASTTDWLYMGASAALFVGSVYADAAWLKFNEEPGVRMIGPASVGLTWGFTLGGGYLAQPKCYGLVRSAPPEGDVRTKWPVAVALGMLAAASAPMIEFFFTGPIPPEWAVRERFFRIVASSAGGLTGALLPYLLPPKTWRAAKELESIRAGADTSGVFFSYSLRF